MLSSPFVRFDSISRKGIADLRGSAATVNAPHQQTGHTKALNPTLEIVQGKILCRRGVHTQLP